MNKIVSFILFFAVLGSWGCGDEAKLGGRRIKIKVQEMKLSDEAIQRKARSLTILKEEKIPCIDWLPVIETAAEAKIRTKEEIAKRAIALCIVALKGEGLEQPIIEQLVAKYRIVNSFSPKERAFIHNQASTQAERNAFTWRYESYWVMLWALGYVDKLERADNACDVVKAVRILKELSADEFIKQAKLRSPAEILDAADLIYRYHWATEDARIKKIPSPANLNPDVLLERHTAFNWLIGYMNQDWDDVSTDT